MQARKKELMDGMMDGDAALEALSAEELGELVG